MKEKFVMTAFGVDRRGFVSDVAKLLYENDCNIEDTAMMRLEGEFALILVFTSVGDDTDKRLRMECRRLEREKGISAFCRTVETAKEEEEPTGSMQALYVEGHELAGIIYKITKYLAEKNINIERLVSKIRPSPETGSDLYAIEISIYVPSGMSEKKLDDELDRIADELRVEITRSEPDL